MLSEIKYLGISKHQGINPSSTYYNISVENCYDVFDVTSGDIISIIDVMDPTNSVCIKNPLFEPTGISLDEIPMNHPIVIGIIDCVQEIHSHQSVDDVVTILEVVGNYVIFFDTCVGNENIKSTIKIKVRESKINSIL